MPEELEVPVQVPSEFSVFVEVRWPVLHRFATLVSGDSVEASDLVQDALERAWPRWASLVDAGTADAYIRRSIANGSVSRWRKLRRQVVVATPPVDERGPRPPDDAGIAWNLCGELPALQRAAVVLRYAEDLPYDEIANVLGCAEATARSHVHRALKTLRERLREGDDDE